jgi:hypothetical protein
MPTAFILVGFFILAAAVAVAVVVAWAFGLLNDKESESEK